MIADEAEGQGANGIGLFGSRSCADRRSHPRESSDTRSGETSLTVCADHILADDDVEATTIGSVSRSFVFNQREGLLRSLVRVRFPAFKPEQPEFFEPARIDPSVLGQPFHIGVCRDKNGVVELCRGTYDLIDRAGR